jgi:hemerythrin-like metal-binding protein
MNIPENIAGIDYRHMQLENMVDKVCEMLEYGYALFIVEDALDEIVKQTEINFGEEEKLMRRYRYENLKSHISMHEVLYSKLIALREKLLSAPEQGKKQENRRDLLAFLKTDFRAHMREDKKALESGQVAIPHAVKRLSEYTFPSHKQNSHANENFTYSNGVLAFRGIFRYSTT